LDVNVRFKKINDFEFTQECLIFDLLYCVLHSPAMPQHILLVTDIFVLSQKHQFGSWMAMRSSGWRNDKGTW